MSGLTSVSFITEKLRLNNNIYHSLIYSIYETACKMNLYQNNELLGFCFRVQNPQLFEYITTGISNSNKININD